MSTVNNPSFRPKRRPPGVPDAVQDRLLLTTLPLHRVYTDRVQASETDAPAARTRPVTRCRRIFKKGMEN